MPETQSRVRRRGRGIALLGAVGLAASCARFGFEQVGELDAELPVVLSDSDDGDALADAGAPGEPSPPECMLGTLSNCSACGDTCSLSSWPNVAEFSCVSSACGVASCQSGFGDCDGNPENGCERPLNTLADCGGCGASCSLPNGETTCESGTCELAGCGSGFDDCDDDPLNGCETPLDTLADCGGCGVACDAGGAPTASCSGGICSAASCTPPLADCDADGVTCETDLRTLEDCATCGTPCGDGSGRLPNATASCVTGSCGIGACDSGFENCDGSAANGCEAQIGSEAHCGGCNDACSATETCDQGTCVGSFSSYDPSNIDSAALDPSGPDLVLDCGTVNIDTTSLSTGGWCGGPAPQLVVQEQDSGPDLVVVPVKSLTVAAGTTLRAAGSRGLAFAVFGDVLVAGSIDVSAAGASGGAGNHWNCFSSLGVNGTGTSEGGGGGGGGGAFRANGGRGGNGGPGVGGNGGVARGSDLLSPLIPGCNGGWGGGCGAGPGGGGGALQIAATGRLDVTGSVLAQGGNGVDGCGTRGGASGGGSGGAILLEAHQIFISGGSVLAGGGNGGRGANGGAPGLGSATGAGQNGTGHGVNGGGGGGGSAGRIRLAAAQSCSLAGTITPAASTSCP